jgi:hypothetical protein
MLQELATETGSSVWAIGSMFFFLAIWVVIAVRVVRSRPEDYEAQARLALDGEAEEWHGVPTGAPTKR